MNNPKILITADTHFTDHGGRLAQSERTARWIEAEARRHDVSLIIHAGDVYETPRPSAATEAMVMGWFRRLAEIAPVVVLVGNHDRPRGGAHALLPLRAALGAKEVWYQGVIAAKQPPYDLIIVDEPRCVQVTLDMPLGRRSVDLRLHCIPYPERATVASVTNGGDEAAAVISASLDALLAYAAAQAREEAADGYITGIAFHGTMRGAAYSEWQTVPLTDPQMDAAPHWNAFHVHAAGHLHRRQEAPGTGLPGYVGAPDRHDFGDEWETPGIGILEVRPLMEPTGEGFGMRFGRQIALDFIPNPNPLKYHTIPAHDLSEFHPRLDEWTDYIGRHPEAIYRITGTVDEALGKRIAEMVRAQRAKGIDIRNATQVETPTRTRVALSAPALGGDRVAIVEAVMRARGMDGDGAALLADVETVWPT